MGSHSCRRSPAPGGIPQCASCKRKASERPDASTASEKNSLRTSLHSGYRSTQVNVEFPTSEPNARRRECRIRCTPRHEGTNVPDGLPSDLPATYPGRSFTANYATPFLPLCPTCADCFSSDSHWSASLTILKDFRNQHAWAISKNCLLTELCSFLSRPENWRLGPSNEGKVARLGVRSNPVATLRPVARPGHLLGVGESDFYLRQAARLKLVCRQVRQPKAACLVSVHISRQTPP